MKAYLKYVGKNVVLLSITTQQVYVQSIVIFWYVLLHYILKNMLYRLILPVS